MAPKRLLIGSRDEDLTLDGTTTTNYTKVINLARVDAVAFHLVWTATAGSLNATATLQESCKPDADPDSDADWVDSADVTFTGVSGTDAKELVNVGNIGSGLMRLKFARSSGSGSVTAYWTEKKKD